MGSLSRDIGKGVIVAGGSILTGAGLGDYVGDRISKSTLKNFKNKLRKKNPDLSEEDIRDRYDNILESRVRLGRRVGRVIGGGLGAYIAETQGSKLVNRPWKLKIKKKSKDRI